MPYFQARLTRRVRACLCLTVSAAWVAACAGDARAQKRDPQPEPRQPEIMSKIDDLRIRHRTEHYALAGTIEQRKLEEYGRALEYIHKEYVKGFDKLLKEEKKGEPGSKGAARSTAKKPPTPKSKAVKGAGGRSTDPAEKESDEPEDEEGDQDRFRVIFFRDNKEYQSFGKAYLGGSTEHTDGMFVPALKSLLITEHKEAEETYSLLFHEAFHQFICRHIPDPPMWLNEGLATYYGAAKPTPRGLDWSNPPKDYWSLCRRAIQFNAHIPVLDVTRASRSQFYDTEVVKLPGTSGNLIRRQLFYAEAYTLIHVLIKDRGGLIKLQNYIRDLARDDGKRTREITGKHFDDRACAQLEKAWINFVKTRKDRPGTGRL